MTEELKPVTEKAGGKADHLLVEIGCEELPPKSLDELRDALLNAVSAGLERDNISFDKAASRAYSTPRRLALLFTAVALQQSDQEQERRGPALAVAFDPEGQPSAAALGFARSVNMEVQQLETLKTDKGAWLVARIHIAGKSLEQLIFPILEQAARQLPVPRPMRWSDHEFSFVRPVHWLIVMHGKRVLRGSLLGQLAGNLTRGHRIHAPGPHALPGASDYLEVLKEARVLADQDERKAAIHKQLLAIDPATRIDPVLLSEVNNLVEWPVAIECAFDESFLSVPHEALVASMQDHQRFFPIQAAPASSAVCQRFIAVANLDSADVARVREGFERVIRPRLADARFFMEQDRKQPLEGFLQALDGVIFQKQIGSIGDKSRRMAAISRKLAKFMSLDENTIERAARLAKCDLMTQMVGEFPQLQGTMGRHYALHSGESVAVAEAIEQHYLPRFAGDTIPQSAAGQLVGVADRIDTLVAIFAAGSRPSGNKDPFALRRCALGLVRILLEARLQITLPYLLAVTANELSAQGIAADPVLLAEVREFINERARHYFRDAGHSSEVVTAAMSSAWLTFPDLQERLQALSSFLGQDSGLSLAAANKRIGNILRKSQSEISANIDEDRLILTEEKLLFAEVILLEKTLGPLLAQSNYVASLDLLSRLRPSVDRFFEAVMVMDEDAGLRRNRLALLFRLKSLFDHIADLSVLG
jgi:glycyl-tRNA synthetase beta chain